MFEFKGSLEDVGSLVLIRGGFLVSVDPGHPNLNDVSGPISIGNGSLVLVDISAPISNNA